MTLVHTIRYLSVEYLANERISSRSGFSAESGLVQQIIVKLRARLRVDTWSVLKTHCVVFSVNSPWNIRILRIAMRMRRDTWAISVRRFFFEQYHGLQVTLFRDSIIFRHGNCVLMQWSFHRSRVFFSSRRWWEEETTEWMANECVSETCFDSGDNKDPLRWYAIVFTWVYLPFCLDPVRTSRRFSMERVETRETSGTSVWVDALSLARSFKHTNRRACHCLFILFLFMYVIA